MRERWEEGSVIGKPRSLADRVFPAGFRQRFLHLALRTEPIISAWCAVAQLGEQRYNRVASSSLTRTFQRTAISGNSFTYSQSSVKGIQDCSSQSHGIGCMLRQHSFSLRQPSSALPEDGI